MDERLYRRWLANAARRDVPANVVQDIAREHGITSIDFDVLNEFEEVIDRDGKSFFIASPGTSGSAARKAVLMTYVLNAGTDYNTASAHNDFTETPYSSSELHRIIRRQSRNHWSYDRHVKFIHRNGARLATTPNGMLMGLGGNTLQSLFSWRGGTTFGDIFMLNIHHRDDTAAALRQIIRSGESAKSGEDGQPIARHDHLDLDRLLHHEERHAQQWARLGPAGFIVRYLVESTGIRRRGNAYEADAGLSDGGYR